MKTTTKRFSKITLIFSLLVLVICINKTNYAASQGSLGAHSKATIEISVHVNQTINALSPNELVLSQNRRHISKPFCISHYGFNKNAKIPYEITVENLTIGNILKNDQSETSLPYNVFLIDRNLTIKKQHLVSGITLQKTSSLSSTENINDACKKIGQHLAIEMKASAQTQNSGLIQPGLLMLLISPN